MDTELTPTQRKALKARAHPLHPVVMIGEKGLTEGVLRELDVSLKSHELIKVHVANGDRDEREIVLQSLCAHLRAQPVQHIGRILVIYREKPPEPPPERRHAPPQRLRARTLAKAAAAPGRSRTRSGPGRERTPASVRRAAAPVRRARSADPSSAAPRPAVSRGPAAKSPAPMPARAPRASAAVSPRRAASSARAPAKPRAPRPARTR